VSPDVSRCMYADANARVQSTEDDASLRRRFVKYADPATGTMLLDGFVSFLLSSDNAAIKDEAEQDMQRPLSEYFISSSHNVSFALYPERRGLRPY
jgi:hypothetical protein